MSAALSVCGALLAGCSGASDGDGRSRPEGTGASASGSATAAVAASPQSGEPGAGAADARFTADPARLPGNRSAALELLRAVVAGPDGYGPGYERRTPYESDPADRPVLGTDCVWRQEALPGDVLGSLTRYSRLPAADGRGEVRTAATVTVHRTAAQADWEIADTLEQALRCPDQQLRATERISGLNSVGSGYGSNGNTSADDYLTEIGTYADPALGAKATHYVWSQARLGPVTLAVAVQGGAGYQLNDLLVIPARAIATMETKVRTRLGARR
ncbi:hypothetical protein GCM10010357_41350 [Streptomyces luteireticuli]|uniref:Lipoprotein n=1 Tax=Streptomyces luteireticuli TaxID=173858 RepID=A0ABN0YWY5_9ACTN